MKQVKRQQQQEQQQMMRPQMMMGYGHQMYGDGTIDQINRMASALRLLQNENKKNETLINELKKQHKEAEHGRDKAKINLEIADNKARDIDSMMKQRAYYIDKQKQIEKDLLEQNGENNRLQQMREIEEQIQQLHHNQLEGLKAKQEREANKLAAELKSVINETHILMTKKKTIYEYMNTQEFINPLDYLPNAYVQTRII